MRLQPICLSASILIMACLAGAQSNDVAGSKDPALFTRMPHYNLTDYKESQFDAFGFTVQKGNDTEEQRVEGRKAEYRYDFDSSAGVMPSMLQIARKWVSLSLSPPQQVV